MLLEEGEQTWPGKSSTGPCRQDSAMNCTKLLCAKQISQKCWQHCERPTVASHDEVKQDLESADGWQVGHCVKSHDLKCKENDIGPGASQIIGKAGPEEAANAIENTEQSDNRTGLYCGDFINVL